ncbi:hypothetical protein MAR_007511 [Mya arenaria]|uniref:Peptidase A2 domain-containing protein n=1 Tax=Mya arenaria TaxID=6604 RepID=A0ABY7DE96_MYAAR|nr:hypothetical protein MAR_007511 [Mya arenaria]
MPFRFLKRSFAAFSVLLLILLILLAKSMVREFPFLGKLFSIMFISACPPTESLRFHELIILSFSNSVSLSEQQPPDAATGTAHEDSLNLSDISDSAVEETLVFEVIREEETEMAAITLQKFSGNPGDRAEDWLVWYTDYSNALGWTEEKMKLSLPFFLDGHARIFYQSLAQDNKRFDKFIDLFKARFNGNDGLSVGMNVLSLKQGPDEAVASYFSRVLQLTPNGSCPDDFLFAATMAGLLPHIKAQVMVQPNGLASVRGNTNRHKIDKQRNKQPSTKCAKNSSVDSTYVNASSESEEVNVATSLIRNTVNIDIFGKTVSALVDSGASISCIHAATFKKLSDRQVTIQNSHLKSIVGVGGERHSVLGEVCLTLKIGGLQIDQKFIVLENLHHSLILGLDFMTKNHVRIDFHQKLMSVGEDFVFVGISCDSLFGYARPTSKVIIEANSEVIVEVKVSKNHKNDTVLLEPSENLSAKFLAGARSLVTTKNHRAKMRLMNPTNKNITLHPFDIVGVVSLVESNETHMLNELESSDNVANVETEDNMSNKFENNEIQFDISNANLSEQQKLKLRKFLQQNTDVFSTSLASIGKTDIFTHKIETLPDLECSLLDKTMISERTSNNEMFESCAGSNVDQQTNSFVENCQRKSEYFETTLEYQDIPLVGVLTSESMYDQQRKCQFCMDFINALENDIFPEDETRRKSVVAQIENMFFMRDGLSPYQMVFGQTMNLPIDTSLIPKATLGQSVQQYFNDLLRQLKVYSEIATQNLQKQADKAKTRHDKNAKEPMFQVGDKILLKQDMIPTGQCPKLTYKRDGPYQIIELGPHFTYKLKHIETNKVLKSFMNAIRLTPYIERQTIADQNPNRDAPADRPNIIDGPDHGDNPDPVVPMQEPPQQVLPNNPQTDKTTQKTDTAVQNSSQIGRNFSNARIIRTSHKGGVWRYRIEYSDNVKEWKYEQDLPQDFLTAFLKTHHKNGKLRKKKCFIKVSV